MADSQKVRLQIHVEQALAERIENAARRMNRSTAWLVAELLIQAIESRERVVEWLVWRTIMLLGGADPLKLCEKFGRKTPHAHQKGAVYLQTHVAPDVAEKIALLAAAYQRSRADMATQLLTWLMDDEEWLIWAVTSRWCRAWFDCIGLPRGEQSPGNAEENRGAMSSSSTAAAA